MWQNTVKCGDRQKTLCQSCSGGRAQQRLLTSDSRFRLLLQPPPSPSLVDVEAAANAAALVVVCPTRLLPGTEYADPAKTLAENVLQPLRLHTIAHTHDDGATERSVEWRVRVAAVVGQQDAVEGVAFAEALPILHQVHCRTPAQQVVTLSGEVADALKGVRDFIARKLREVHMRVEQLGAASTVSVLAVVKACHAVDERLMIAVVELV
jgi:hypothetical protein